MTEDMLYLLIILAILFGALWIMSMIAEAHDKIVEKKEESPAAGKQTEDSDQKSYLNCTRKGA